jgi:hypothetical protein
MNLIFCCLLEFIVTRTVTTSQHWPDQTSRWPTYQTTSMVHCVRLSIISWLRCLFQIISPAQWYNIYPWTWWSRYSAGCSHLHAILIWVIIGVVIEILVISIYLLDFNIRCLDRRAYSECALATRFGRIVWIFCFHTLPGSAIEIDHVHLVLSFHTCPRRC